METLKRGQFNHGQIIYDKARAALEHPHGQHLVYNQSKLGTKRGHRQLCLLGNGPASCCCVLQKREFTWAALGNPMSISTVCILISAQPSMGHGLDLEILDQEEREGIWSLLHRRSVGPEERNGSAKGENLERLRTKPSTYAL